MKFKEAKHISLKTEDRNRKSKIKPGFFWKYTSDFGPIMFKI